MHSDTEYFHLALVWYLNTNERLRHVKVGEWATSDLMKVLGHAQELKSDDQKQESHGSKR